MQACRTFCNIHFNKIMSRSWSNIDSTHLYLDFVTFTSTALVTFLEVICFLPHFNHITMKLKSEPLTFTLDVLRKYIRVMHNIWDNCVSIDIFMPRQDYGSNPIMPLSITTCECTSTSNLYELHVNILDKKKI